MTNSGLRSVHPEHSREVASLTARVFTNLVLGLAGFLLIAAVISDLPY